MHFETGLRQKMREDFAHPGLNPLSFFISSNCQTSVLDFGISLLADEYPVQKSFFKSADITIAANRSAFQRSALLQQGNDRQMLRTCAFALAALDTVTCLAFAFGNDRIFSLCAEFRTAFFAVLNREDLRDRNAHRTAFGAVMAGCAGDRFISVQCFHSLCDHCFLMFVQRFEISHEAEVVFHLLYHFGKSTTPDRPDQTWVNCLNLFVAGYTV